MPLTASDLIVEDGSGVISPKPANSYVSLADANTYFSTRPFSSNWTAATVTDDTKVQALISSARLLDRAFTWNGNKRLAATVLLWPRDWVPDPDATLGPFPLMSRMTYPAYLDPAQIPNRLRYGQMETALVMLGSFASTQMTGDQPYSDPETRLRSMSLGGGALSMSFDALSMQIASGSTGIINNEIEAILAGIGVYKFGESGTVRIKRGM